MTAFFEEVAEQILDFFWLKGKLKVVFRITRIKIFRGHAPALQNFGPQGASQSENNPSIIPMLKFYALQTYVCTFNVLRLRGGDTGSTIS